MTYGVFFIILWVFVTGGCIYSIIDSVKTIRKYNKIEKERESKKRFDRIMSITDLRA